MPRRHLIVALLGLLGLVAWEWSGRDLTVSTLYGGAGGFGWRDQVLTRDVLHTGGRWLAALLLALLVFDATRPIVAGPPRRQRWIGVLVSVTALVVVPALKRASATSCPWDLAAFGGAVPYVPHWWLGTNDGGPGHCFPSGHAVAAFAFYGVGFAWERHRPGLARAWWIALTALGLLFGWAQLARGAHFVSHTLWSAWLCWMIGAGGFAVLLRGQPSALSRAFGHGVRLRARRRAAQQRLDPAKVDTAHADPQAERPEWKGPRGESPSRQCGKCQSASRAAGRPDASLRATPIHRGLAADPVLAGANAGVDDFNNWSHRIELAASATRSMPSRRRTPESSAGAA